MERASEEKAMRTYYKHDAHRSFDFIQVAEHVFVETCTLELFSTMMLNSWYV